jgi:hypothetical protein
MRRADLTASLFAVFLGLIAIYLGLMTDTGFGTILIVVSAYFIGSIFVFFLSLSAPTRANLETLEVSYGKKYWLSLIIGATVSIFVGVIYGLFFNTGISEAILVGLGTMAILTAFVSPNYNEKTRLDNAEEFG